MSEIKITWKGLHNDRERMIFLDGFWTGVDAGKQIQEEVRKLGQQISSEKEIQRTAGERGEG